MNEQAAAAALVAATALHAGFQAVVTLLVYPAFADVPVEHWSRYHSDHSRRITGIVMGVYALLVVASAGVLVAGPWNAGTLTAVGLAALAMLTTPRWPLRRMRGWAVAGARSTSSCSFGRTGSALSPQFWPSSRRWSASGSDLLRRAGRRGLRRRCPRAG